MYQLTRSRPSVRAASRRSHRGTVRWMAAATALLAAAWSLMAVQSARAACEDGLLGDVNGDGSVSVVDVQCGALISLAVLLGPPEPLPGCMAGTLEEVDVNCQPGFSITDILLTVQVVLGQALSPLIDVNSNGCPDACEAPGCGDGIIVPPEVCDDGNTLAGDGCSPLCELEGGRLSIISPAAVSEGSCGSSAGCTGGGVCIDSMCMRGWGIDSVRAIRVEALDLPIAGQTVRICSNVFVGTAAACVGGGHVVATAPLTAGTAEVQLNHLPAAQYQFTAEVQTAVGASTWVSSLANPVASFRRRFVAIDLTAPSVLSLTALSDVLAPAGVLNAAEQEGPRTFRFGVHATEMGKVEFSAQQALKAVGVLDATGAGNALVAFASDGQKTVTARAVDLVGNRGPAVSLSVLVDTVAPSAAIVYPDQATVVAGDSTDIVVQAGAGAAVQLFDAGALVGSGTVSSSGLLTFAGLLSEGAHELSVVVTDAAGNASQATTDPAVVLVDTIAPGLSVTAPLSGKLNPNDDAGVEIGFQVDVTFSSPDAVQWRIRRASGCASDFTGCSAPVVVASALAAPPIAVDTMITLPSSESAYHVVTVEALDAVGNVASAVRQLELNAGPCAVSVTGLPLDGWINAAHCAQGTACSQVTLDLEVDVPPSCGPISEVQLLVDGAPVDAAIPSGGMATLELTVSDGAAVHVSAVALDNGGAPVATSGGVPLGVDLTPPTIQFASALVSGFMTPSSGTTANWGAAVDLDGDTPGLQVHLRLQGTDGGNAGTLVSVERFGPGGPTPVAGIPVPQAIAAWPWTRNLLFATFPHGATGDVVARVRDQAGNEATTSFFVNADLQAPAAVQLEPIDPADVSPRLPSLKLRWTATGDDGASGSAMSYDIRFSRGPILTDEDFEAACPAQDVIGTTALPTPAPAGTLEAYTLQGPDPRAAAGVGNPSGCKWAALTTIGEQYTFAVRAIDEVGNASPIAASSAVSTDLVALHFAKVSSTLALPNPGNFDSYVFGVGDVNADGFDDVAMGGRDSHGFCLVYGRAGAVADITIGSLAGPQHRCIVDAGATALGSPVVALGDLNGDGIDDFGAGAGGFGAPDSAEELRVWLGRADGAFANSADLIIRGTSNGFAFGLPVAGGGNFNGDASLSGAPLFDIALGSRTDNLAFVVPGAESWPAPVLDLDSAADRAAFGVVTVEMTDAPSDAAFGFRVGFAGDVLAADGLGCDELLVTQSKGLGQVVVLRGQPSAGGATAVRLTQVWSGAEPGDADTVRLRQESSSSKSAFGSGLAAGDFDADGLADVVVNHPTNARLHLFRGAALQNKLGGSVRIEAGALLYDGVRPGANGWLFEGEFDSVANIGNFDGDSVVAGGTPDLGYGYFDLFLQNFGAVFVRANAGLAADGTQLGLLPFEDLAVEEPFPTDQPDGFGKTVAPAGDFNGDGRPDLIVGAEGAGYTVLVY